VKPYVLRAADHRPVPWKNGGGTTVALAVGPGWRASLATVASDGPFSDFTGYDRILVLLDGPGFTLRFDDRDHILTRPLEPFAFDGGLPCTALLRGGPCRDWNWMVARDRFRGSVIRVDRPGMVSGRVLFALGPAELALGRERFALSPHDTLVAPDRGLGTLVSGGPLLVADAMER
jgi:environmental stress-induced protein Ves